MITVFCKNNGESKKFEAGVSLIEVYNGFNLKMTQDVVAALVNNEVTGLTFRLYRNKDVEFLDITSDAGMRL